MNGKIPTKAGYIIGINGQPVCAGVVCKCDGAASIFCPMHGRIEQQQRDKFDSQVDEGYDGLHA